MNILTSIEERLRNGQRYARWQRSLHRQGSGASSRPSGWEVFSECVGACFLAVIGIAAAIVLMGLATEGPKPVEAECAYQWTADARYVRHCLIDGEWRVEG